MFSGLTYATVGLNAGNGRNYTTVPGSNTAGIINISNTSNVGKPGIWAFQANLAELSGINKECCNICCSLVVGSQLINNVCQCRNLIQRHSLFPT